MTIIQQSLALNFNFTFDGQHRVRVIDRNGVPWFVAADVCDVLGINNSRQALARLDADEKDSVISNDSIGRRRKIAVVNEPGVYALINASRKPEAKAFQRWVNHDVLPSIRRTGEYKKPPRPFESTKRYKELRNSGLSHEEALDRRDTDQIGIEAHKRAVAEWYQRNGDIAQLTNHATRLVTGKSATALKRELQIKVSPRAYISTLERGALAIIEDFGALLHRRRDSRGTGELARDLNDASQVIDHGKLAAMLSDAPILPPPPPPAQHQLPDMKRDWYDDTTDSDRFGRNER